MPFLDPADYDRTVLTRYGHTAIRRGARRRMFFASNPDHALHLHKALLIRRQQGYADTSLTHLTLPRRLNAGFDRIDRQAALCSTQNFCQIFWINRAMKNTKVNILPKRSGMRTITTALPPTPIFGLKAPLSMMGGSNWCSWF